MQTNDSYSQVRSISIQTTSEQLTDNLAMPDGLLDNAFDMPRLYSSVPDRLPGKRTPLLLNYLVGPVIFCDHFLVRVQRAVLWLCAL